MAQQTINVGTAPNDGTGTPLRTAFQYTNSNFSELYTATGPSGNNITVPGTATITGDLTVDTSTLKVDSANNVVGITNASPLAGTDGGLTVGTIGSSKAIAVSMFNCFARLRERDAINNFAITTNIDTTNAVLDDNTRTSWKVRFGSGNDNFLIQRAAIGSTTFQDLYSVSTTSAVWYDGAGGTRMTLNSTGLGVGGSPTTGVKLHVGGGNAHIRNAAGGQTKLIFGPSANYVEMGGIIYDDTDGTITFGTIQNYATKFITNNTERGRFDASGNLLVGKTSGANSAAGVNIYKDATDGGRVYLTRQSGSAVQYNVAFFESGGSAVGSISTTNTATSYNISSDYRLKEAVQPLVGGLARISALKPSIYKWKIDGSSSEGFLAHELAEAVPLAVTGDKDAVNEDGSIKPQAVDLSKVVPVLVAAIQELTARVQTLETR